MKNTYSFDELEMTNLFKGIISDSFRKDETKEEDYWYNLFGYRDAKIYESYQIDEPQFPCFVVTMEAIPYKRNSHSSEIEQFSLVTVYIEHYNQSINNLGKDTLGIMINHRLKTVLQSTFGAEIVLNKPLESFDNSVYRRRIEARFVYDNKNKVFYRE